MNRNVLFQKSLLSAAVVVVLNTYSVGAVAVDCPAPVNTLVSVTDGSNCDAITNSVDGEITDVELGGTVTDDITTSAAQNYFRIYGNGAGARTVSGNITNSGTLNDGSVPEADADDDGFGDGNVNDDDDDELPNVGLHIEGATVGGTITNTQSGTITAFDSGIEIRDADVKSVTNSGNIVTNGWGSSAIRAVGSTSTITGNVINEGKINSEGDGITLGGLEAGGTMTGNIDNSGNINSFNSSIYIGGGAVLNGSISNSGNIFGLGQSSNGILVEDSTVNGDITNSGEINANTGILVWVWDTTTSVGDIINDDSGLILGDSYGIVLDGSTVGSIVNSGLISANIEDGIYITSQESGISSTVTNGIHNSYDILARKNAISISADSTIGTSTFGGASAETAIFNTGYISGKKAGIRLLTGADGSGGANITGSGFPAIINEGGINGYFGIIIDGLNDTTEIVNSGVINSNNPSDIVLTGLDFDDISAFPLPGVGGGDGGGDGGGPQPPPESPPSLFSTTTENDDSSEDPLSHAIYSVETTQTLTITNSSGGRIEGRVAGPTLALNNSGTFRTLPGSDMSSYGGSGTLVAVLNKDIQPYNGTGEPESTVLTADTITFGADAQILVDNLISYKGSPEGNNYVIAYEDGVRGDIAGESGITVDSASALLDVELVDDVDNPDMIIVKVSSKGAGNVIAKFGVRREIQLMMNDFISDVLPELKDKDPNNPLVQFLEDAANDEASLLALSEALEPETSGSNTAGATITQSASFGSVSTRTSSSRTGTNSGGLFQDGGVWAQYLHSKGKQDPRAESDGFDSRLNGITFGVDGDINDQWTLGIALTAADVTTSSTTGSSSVTDTSSYIGTLYGSWQNDDRFVDIMASAGLSKNETESMALTDRITSEYDAKQVGLRLVTGLDFWLENQAMVLQPNLSFNYGRIDIEAYEESGEFLPKAYEKQSYEVVELGAGITAIKSFELGRGVLNTSLGLNVYHDFAADQVEIESRFISGGSFITTPGAEPEKTTWQASLGLNYQISNTLSASVNYDHTRKSTFAADSASIKLRYDF